MVRELCICIGYISSFSVSFFSGSRILTLGEIPKDTIYPMKYPFTLTTVDKPILCLLLTLSADNICKQFGPRSS